MIRVGFDSTSYSHERNIYGAEVPGVSLTQVQRLPCELLLPQSGLRSVFEWSYLPIPWVQRPVGERRGLSWRGVDLYHLFNRVSWGRRPWGASFESKFPRFERLSEQSSLGRRAVRNLAHPSCRFLVAMSESARRDFRRAHPDVIDDLEPKLSVVPPMQLQWSSREAVEEKLARPFSLPLRCLFVGHHYFRKGGRGLRRALERLPDPRAVHVTVVSRLVSSEYVTQTTAADTARERQLLEEHPQVTLIDSAGRDEVDALMRDAHVFCLPTLDDSYGYVVLEAQSQGTPVISTNVRAQSEINPADVGWVLPLARGERRPEFWEGMEHPHGSPERGRSLEAAEETLADGIAAVIEEILADPTALGDRGRLAYERVAARNAPGVHAESLRRIYEAAL